MNVAMLTLVYASVRRLNIRLNHANRTVADPVSAFSPFGLVTATSHSTIWLPPMVRNRFTVPLTATSSLGTTGEVKRVFTVPPLCHVDG